MIVSLIGMSGVGKSYWSQLMASQGFQRFCVDDLIEEKLAPILNQLGYSGINDVAEWMGQPYEERSSQNQARYLACEIEVMEELIAYVRGLLSQKNVVIDTTGSVIYTGDQICTFLRALTTVVYLEVSPEQLEQMLQLYLDDPKPVLWGDIFRQLPNESPQAALARCYPDLLQYRIEKYRQYAHVTLPYAAHRAPHLTLENFYAFL